MLKALLSDLSDYRVLFFPSSLSFLVIEFNKSGSSDCVEIRAIYISKKKFYNLFVRRPRSTASDRSTLQIRSTHWTCSIFATSLHFPLLEEWEPSDRHGRTVQMLRPESKMWSRELLTGLYNSTGCCNRHNIDVTLKLMRNQCCWPSPKRNLNSENCVFSKAAFATSTARVRLVEYSTREILTPTDSNH